MPGNPWLLLKNDGILPLKENGQKIAFIGKFAEKPRFQGGGSSHINSFKVTGALEAVKKYADVSYAQGYDVKEDKADEAMLAEAVCSSRECGYSCDICRASQMRLNRRGMTGSIMRMPECQNRLIAEIVKVQPNTVVVLHNGSPVEMPWADDVRGILESYLCGQAVGEAQVDLLFGRANPCGKLAETIPYKLCDNPSYLNFPGDGRPWSTGKAYLLGTAIMITKEMPVRYPFGYGLSYTTFAYSDLKLSAKEIKGYGQADRFP